MIVDLFLVTNFVTRLVSPFDKWPAYRSGVIDAQGNILVAPRKRSIVQKRSFGYFDVLALNLKKILPAGNNPWMTTAAVTFLLKEPRPVNEDDFDETMPGLEDAFEKYLDEDAPVNAVGTGAIASTGVGVQGEPPKKKNKNQILRRKYTVNGMVDTTAGR